MKEARRPKSLDVPLFYKLRSNKSCSLESPDRDVTKPQRVAFVTSDVLLLVDGWKFRRGKRRRKKGKPRSTGGFYIARPYTWGPSDGEESDGCDVTLGYDVTVNSYDDKAFIEELEEGEVIPSPVVCKREKKKLENKNLISDDEDADHDISDKKVEVCSAEIANSESETVKTGFEKSEIENEISEKLDVEVEEENLNAEENYEIVENLMSDMLDKICSESKIQNDFVMFDSKKPDETFELQDQVR